SIFGSDAMAVVDAAVHRQYERLRLRRVPEPGGFRGDIHPWRMIPPAVARASGALWTHRLFLWMAPYPLPEPATAVQMRSGECKWTGSCTVGPATRTLEGCRTTRRGWVSGTGWGRTETAAPTL